MAHLSQQIPRIILPLQPASDGFLARNAENRARANVIKTLCGYIEDVHPLPAGNSLEDPVGQFARALRNMYLLLNAAANDGLRTVMCSLTPSDMHAFALLREWWTVARVEGDEESAVDVWVKPCIVLHAMTFWRQGWQELEDLAPLPDRSLVHTMRHVVDGPETCDCPEAPAVRDLKPVRGVLERLGAIYGTVSVYHHHMVRLFLTHLSEPVFPIDEVRQVTRQASLVAAAERLGQACWKSFTKPTENIPEHVPGVEESEKEIGADQETVRWIPEIHEIPKTLPAIADACFWLDGDGADSTNIADQLPYYLWDIEKERTVETRTLESSTVSYAILSYTWGRWRRPGTGIRFTGVPWYVPANDRFDVTKLPETLRWCGFQERYIWVDIFCIPQRSDDEALAKICQQELARQATIFRHATTAVAWFQDIDGWDDATWNLEYEALGILAASTHPSFGGGKLATITNHLSGLVAFAPQTSGFSTLDSVTGEPALAAWFTSLWTLQESMMRPDMLLLDKYWEPLTVARETPVCLGDLMALMDARTTALSATEAIAHQTSSVMPRLPPVDGGAQAIWDATTAGVGEFRGLFGSSGLFNFRQPDPILVMVQGRSRHCTHSRAEAIMSVTGATKWHLQRPINQFQKSGDLRKKGDLVCGLYPLSFVEEVFRMNGAHFFMWYHDIATVMRVPPKSSVSGEDGGVPHAATWATNPGSMMPFMTNTMPGRPSSFRSQGILSNDDLTDHATVKGWGIHGDGSVELPDVALIVSKGPPGSIKTRYALPLGVRFMVGGNKPSDPENAWTVAELDVDLIEWVQQYAGEAHAVCTRWSRTRIAGIVLQRLDDDESRFTKVATFSVPPVYYGPAFEMPETTRVNWHVL